MVADWTARGPRLKRGPSGSPRRAQAPASSSSRKPAARKLDADLAGVPRTAKKPRGGASSKKRAAPRGGGDEAVAAAASALEDEERRALQAEARAWRRRYRDLEALRATKAEDARADAERRANRLEGLLDASDRALRAFKTLTGVDLEAAELDDGGVEWMRADRAAAHSIESLAFKTTVPACRLAFKRRQHVGWPSRRRRRPADAAKKPVSPPTPPQVSKNGLAERSRSRRCTASSNFGGRRLDFRLEIDDDGVYFEPAAGKELLAREDMRRPITFDKDMFPLCFANIASSIHVPHTEADEPAAL